MQERGKPFEATDEEIRETQLEPVAGIWRCPNCERRIQVMTDSDVPKVQAFVCVCGAKMEPGEEHTQPLQPDSGTAVDE